MNQIKNKTYHQLLFGGITFTCLGAVLILSPQSVAQPQNTPPSSESAVPQPTRTPVASASLSATPTKPLSLPPVPVPPTSPAPLAPPQIPEITISPESALPHISSLPPVPAKVSTPARSTKAVGPITGTGTTGTIAKFTGTNAIGNSILVERSGKIGLGTTNPTGALSVVANATSPSIYGSNAGSGTAINGISSGGSGVYGSHSSASGDTAAILGETSSTSANGTGVRGVVKSTSPGASSSGVRGINQSTSTTGFGVYGSHAGGGAGVLGDSASGIGVRGRHTATSGTDPAVLGETNSTAANATAVQGTINSTSPGSSSAAVRGINKGTGFNGYGVYGSQAGSGNGVYGISPSGVGVKGTSTDGTGVQGASTDSIGVYGTSTSGLGVYGSSQSSYGTYGYSYSSNGVYGQSYNGNGVYGKSANSYAGYFEGNVMITGNLAKASGSFKIDNPLHPATEYLSHSFVESPDMMNVYNGNVTLDSKGQATVTLPAYFQALNSDFRYQLTPIGAPASLYIAQKISGNHFKIAGGKPGLEVSWMVTGVRQDAYARDHRIKVEENKSAIDQGKYLYPAGFGAGQDKQIGPNTPRLAAR